MYMAFVNGAGRFLLASGSRVKPEAFRVVLEPKSLSLYLVEADTSVVAGVFAVDGELGKALNRSDTIDVIGPDGNLIENLGRRN
jgi:hypothetical protein